MLLSESGTCTQGDDSIYLVFLQLSFAVSLFVLFTTWFGIPSGGTVGLVLAGIPFFIALYFYIAFVPVYFVYSTIHGLGLCAIVQFDLVIGSALPSISGEEPAGFFARSYALASILPVLATYYPVYRIWKSGSFSRKPAV